jgi:hypothetical protein
MPGGLGIGTAEVVLSGDASDALSAIQAVQDALNGLASMAAGVAIGETIAAGFQSLTDTLGQIPSQLIDINSQMEGYTTTFGVYFQNADKNIQNTSATAKTNATTIQNATDNVTSAQDRVTAAMSRSGGAASRVGQEMAKAEQQTADALAKLQVNFDKTNAAIEKSNTQTTDNIVSSYQKAVQQINDSLQQAQQQAADAEKTATRNYNDQLQAREQAFQQSMANLVASHAQAVANMQQAITALTASWQAADTARQTAFQDQLDGAVDGYESQKQAAASHSKTLQQEIDAEVAKGAGADQTLVAALRERLADEQELQNGSYSSYLSKLQAQQAATEKTATDSYNAQMKKLTDQQAAEAASFAQKQAALTKSYNDELGKLREAYNNQMTTIQDHLNKTVEADHKALADKAKAEQDALAKQKQMVQDQLDNEKQKYQDSVDSYKKSLADKLAALEQSNSAGGASNNNAIKSAQDALKKAQDKLAADLAGGGGKGVGNQRGFYQSELPQMLANMNAGQVYGQQQQGSQQQATEFEDYLKNATLGTPFNRSQLNESSKILMGFGLDAVKWFQTVGNTASAMNVPLDQVASTMGRIASGETGRGIFELQAMGVNLRGTKGLDFDAAGGMTTSLDKAMPIIQKALDDRFGGMMAVQAKTWKGILSNFQDTWINLSETIGKPIFKDLEKDLQSVYDWFNNNTDEVNKLGDAVGKGLDKAFKDVAPIIAQVAQNLANWVGSGSAEKDIGSIINGITGLVAGFVSVIQTINQFKEVIGVALLVLFALTGPIAVIISAIIALHLIWSTNFLGIQTVMTGFYNITKPLLDVIGKTFGESFGTIGNVLPLVIDQFARLFSAIGPIVGVVLVLAGALINGLGGSLGFISYALLGVVQVITGVISLVAHIITGLVTIVVDLFKGDWAAAWLAAGDLVNNVASDIGNILIGLARVIGDTIAAAVNFVISTFQFLYDALIGHSIVPDMVNGIEGAFTGMWTSIQSGMTSAWTAIQAAFQASWKVLTDFIGIGVTTVLKAFNDLWIGVKNGALTALGGMLGAIIGILNGLLSVIQTFLNTIIDVFNKWASGILAVANSALSKVPGSSPVTFNPADHISIGQIDTSGLNSLINPPTTPMSGSSAPVVGGNNVVAQVVQASQQQAPVVVMMDGQVVGNIVRNQQILTNTRNGGMQLFGASS